MTGTMISQGLTLMLAGMGTVFVFLTVLVIAMRLMAMAVARLQPASEQAGDEEIAAIAAAIAAHRKQ